MPIEEYGPLKKYRETRDRVNDQELPTREKHLRKAYDAALETTKTADGRLVDLATLDNDTARATFKNAFKANFQDSARNYMGMTAGVAWDEFQADAAQDGIYGTTQGQFATLIESLKKGLTFDQYMEAAKKGLEDKSKVLQSRILSQLNEGDKVSVMSQIGIAQEKVYLDRVTIGNLAELVNQFDQLGVISPTWLNKQPYTR